MKNQDKKYWWNHLLAIPPSKEHDGFKRIYRLITDTTRVRNYKIGKLNEFYHHKHETHLTSTLWENFSVFDDYSWVNILTKYTDLPIEENVVDCKWSYEWEKKHEGKNKLLDIVISFKTNSENGVIIIESKNLGKTLGVKDTDPNYYLNIEDFSSFDHKYYIYCIDQKVEKEVKKQVGVKTGYTGFLTWQELAKVQLDMVDKLSLNKRLKTFIKRSIYNQFIEKGITPNRMIEEYLENEKDMKSYLEVGFKRHVAEEKLWELD